MTIILLLFLNKFYSETLKVWSFSHGECQNILMNKKPKKLKENDDTRNPSAYYQLLYCEASNELVVVTLDQNLLFFNLNDLKLIKQVY